MWQSALFLFALLGGLKFVTTCYRTKYDARLQDWDRVLFQSAKCGFLIFVALRVAVAPIVETWSCEPVVWAREWRDWIRQWVPVPYIGSLLACYFGASLAAHAANRLFLDPAKELREAVEEHGGELLQLFQRSFVDGLPVLITMRSRKIYVGLIFESASLTKEKYAVLLPTASGYRDEETLSVTFTVEYGTVYRELAGELSHDGASIPDEALRERFGVIIPFSEIVSASPFDVSLYSRFFAPEEASDESEAEDGAEPIADPASGAFGEKLGSSTKDSSASPPVPGA